MGTQKVVWYVMFSCGDETRTVSDFLQFYLRLP